MGEREGDHGNNESELQLSVNFFFSIGESIISAYAIYLVELTDGLADARVRGERAEAAQRVRLRVGAADADLRAQREEALHGVGIVEQ